MNSSRRPDQQFIIQFAMPAQQRLQDKQQRHRRFCFTWNNYPLDAEEHLRCFFERKQGEYMVVGRETGESGTPHLQGYVCLKHAITFAALKKYFPQIHIERARGSPKQNQAYCTKDADFFEVGELPERYRQGGRRSLERDMAKHSFSRGVWQLGFHQNGISAVWVTMSEKLISRESRKPKSLMGILKTNGGMVLQGLENQDSPGRSMERSATRRC